MVQPHLILLRLLPWVLWEETEERSGQSCWTGQGRGSSEDPPSLCHTSRLPRLLGCRTPEAAWKVAVGSQCPCVSSWFILCCLEPWLVVLIVHLCSLFTAFNMTAVHAAQGKPVHVFRLGVASQPCLFFFLQLLETGFFFPSAY